MRTSKILFITLIVVCFLLGIGVVIFSVTDQQNKQDLNYVHNSLQDKFKNQLQHYKNQQSKQTNQSNQSQNSPNLKQQIKKEVEKEITQEIKQELKKDINKLENLKEDVEKDLEENRKLLVDIHSQKKELYGTLLNPYQIVEQKLNNKSIPIYYINLLRSDARNEFVINQFELYGITNYQRVEGVDGSRLDNYGLGTVYSEDSKPFYYRNDYPEGNSMSEVGCLLAHLKAIKKAYDDGFEMAYIMEDDASFTLVPFWNKSIQDIIKDAPKDWTLLQLYYISDKCRKFPDIYIDYNESNHGCWSGAIYLINRKGMSNILDKVYDKESNTFIIEYIPETRLPADFYIFHLAQHTYIYNNEPLFYQYNAVKELYSVNGNMNFQHVRGALQSLQGLV